MENSKIISRNQDINLGFICFFAILSLLISYFQHKSANVFMTDVRLGFILGEAGARFFLAYAAYIFFRKGLAKPHFVNGFLAGVAVFCLLFWSSNKDPYLESENLVQDFTGIVESIDIDEKTGELKVSKISTESDSGNIFNKYISDLYEYSDDFAKKMEANSDPGFEAITEVKLFKDVKLLLKIKDGFQKKRDLTDSFFKGYLQILAKFNEEVELTLKKSHSYSEKELLNGAKATYPENKEKVELMHKISLSYFDAQIEFLDFLTLNNQKIIIQSGTIYFSDSRDLQKYNTLVQSAVKEEENYNNTIAKMQQDFEATLESMKNLLY